MLKEAAQNATVQNSNMREIVGIKVGLEYMKLKDQNQEEQIEKKKSLDQRKKTNMIFNFAIKVI